MLLEMLQINWQTAQLLINMKTALKGNPSEKIKRRYFLIKAISKEEVERAILDYLGILGWAKATPFFVKEDENEMILAIDRKAVNDVRAAFELSPANIKILRVSGTLKGLKKSKRRCATTA